ncbi:predicted protein [Sclerotinia sclerotiorum 1980 UF-70]|uniref:Uncharacterized protein n=1 Tax=Sclerotinia sclerotiorum (strain ATCC 18683 / 1980 / Ss-1) TaxID=665079 RepID=A7ECW4_SCLS1|nr:predicted protein [Sclerotinia sclerotiorum 1980 UF-70]EDO00680.1 predicted protein [Sclerotinia sclerotiorum 1980 UF-70]
MPNLENGNGKMQIVLILPRFTTNNGSGDNHISSTEYKVNEVVAQSLDSNSGWRIEVFCPSMVVGN